jgi:hypothetical protein
MWISINSSILIPINHIAGLAFWIENFEASLHVCLHINTYSIKGGKSLNFIQEYVGIRLPIESTFLYV